MEIKNSDGWFDVQRVRFTCRMCGKMPEAALKSLTSKKDYFSIFTNDAVPTHCKMICQTANAICG